MAQRGRQCGHPEDSDASAEPRLAFPADCGSTKRHEKSMKFHEILMNSVGFPSDFLGISRGFALFLLISRHFFQFQKLSEDLRLPGFVIQSVDSPTQ